MADLENVNNLDASQRSHNPINKGDINVNQHKLSVAKPQVSILSFTKQFATKLNHKNI